METFKKTFLTILVFGFGFHQALAQDQSQRLAAYYPFDGNVNDASENGNNGIFVGNDFQFLTDRFGSTNSLWLNTTSNPSWGLTNSTYVSIPRAIDFNNDFTISVWVDFTNTTPLQNGVANQGYVHNLISNGSDNNGGVNLRIITDDINYTGKDLLQFIWGVPNSSINVPINSLRNTWFQITAVRSGTNLFLYEDGNIVTNGLAFTTTDSPNIWIGRHQNSSSTYPLVGGIDDVSFYGQSFSLSQVQQLFASQSAPMIVLHKAIYVSFENLQVGTNYQLQVSDDLKSWSNFGTSFVATNSTINYPTYWNVGDWNTLFFRLSLN